MKPILTLPVTFMLPGFTAFMMKLMSGMYGKYYDAQLKRSECLECAK
ncbi:MAG TPA: hypothetical protein VI112_03955 [Bacteroidia bacterium]